MGYLGTVASILNEIKSTPPTILNTLNFRKGLPAVEPNPVRRELFNLLEGVTKIPKQEFGRFRTLNFVDKINDDNTALGLLNLLNPGTTIDIARYPVGAKRDDLITFLHELVHAKQFRPDKGDLRGMREMINASQTLPYEHQPMEHHAVLSSYLAQPNPSSFNDAFKVGKVSFLEEVWNQLGKMTDAEVDVQTSYSAVIIGTAKGAVITG